MKVYKLFWRSKDSSGKNRTKHYVFILEERPDVVFYDTYALTKHPEDYGDGYCVLRSINGYSLIFRSIAMTIRSVEALYGAVDHLKKKYNI